MELLTIHSILIGKKLRLKDKKINNWNEYKYKKSGSVKLNVVQRGQSIKITKTVKLNKELDNSSSFDINDKIVNELIFRNE